MSHYVVLLLFVILVNVCSCLFCSLCVSLSCENRNTEVPIEVREGEGWPTLGRIKIKN